MTEPWFDPNRFGAYFGAIVGGGGGSLVGLLGALMGVLLPRGFGRAWFKAAGTVLVVVAACMLAVGLFAVAKGQPFGIWYPMVLTGLVLGPNAVVLRLVADKVGAAAERRKMEAQDLRGL
jgi:hypothetical protein